MAPKIYSEFPASSLWRELAVDLWVYAGCAKWLGYQTWERDPAEFWCEIAKQLLAARQKRGQRPRETDRCQYHEHIGGLAKCT